MPLAQPALHLANLTKNFDGEPVFKDLSLTVNRGEMMTLIGSSGAGKSTLLRAIAGLETVDGGNITLDGAPLETGQVGFVFQTPVLYPHLTLEENILFFSRLKKSPALDREHYNSLVATLGLGAHLAKKPGQLSGGQAQRAGIARALVRKTPVVLFDEPLSSVDEHTSAEIRRDLQKLHRALGFTALYVTHDQNEALQMGNRVAVLGSGRLLQVDAPARLTAAPAGPEVARLIFPLYNELTGTMNGHRARAGISAFCLEVGYTPGAGRLPAVPRSTWIHTVGTRVEAVLTAPAQLPTGSGALSLERGTVLTLVLPGAPYLELGKTLYLEPTPGALHLF